MELVLYGRTSRFATQIQWWRQCQVLKKLGIESGSPGRRMNAFTTKPPFLPWLSGKIKTAACFVVFVVKTMGSQVDSICLPIFLHCGSFSIGPCRPLPYAKLSGTNSEIGTCRGNFTINKLLVEPLIARPLTESRGNSCLKTVAYSILSWIQQAMSFFVSSLEPPEGLYIRHSTARPKTLLGKCLSSG